MWPLRASITVPDEDTVVSGAKYFFVMDVENRSRTGKIWNDHRDVEWHYGPRRNPLGYSLRNPFNKPDFVVFDPNERLAVTIRRVSFVPSRFQILDGEDEDVVGHIAMRSPLHNKYKIDIDQITTCVFRMPLFTVNFHGTFSDITGIWVVVEPSKMQWSVLTRSDLDDVRLLAALAFVNNQWFNYS